MYDVTFEGFYLARINEDKGKVYPEWVEDSSNPEYEKHLWDSDPHNN